MILLVQTPHLENYWPGVYKADEPLWPTGSSVIWHFSPIPTLPTTAAAHCHPLAFHFNRCLILKSHITVESSKAFPTSLPLLLLTFPTWCPLSPSFPTWLTSNSSKFYIKHQLLCKSSLSLVRVCTPIVHYCPWIILHQSTYFTIFGSFLYKFWLQLDCDLLRAWVVLHFLPAEPHTMCDPCLLISTCLCLIISWQTQSLDLIN